MAKRVETVEIRSRVLVDQETGEEIHVPPREEIDQLVLDVTGTLLTFGGMAMFGVRRRLKPTAFEGEKPYETLEFIVQYNTTAPEEPQPAAEPVDDAPEAPTEE